MALTKHDFKCTCGLPGCRAPLISGLLIRKINRVLRRTGIDTLQVRSGARCEAFNRSVGGSPGSAHKRGLAADLNTTALEIEQLRRLWDEIDREQFSLLGVGPGFIHVDIRGANSTIRRYFKTLLKFMKWGK